MQHQPPSLAERDAIYRQVVRNAGIAVFRWNATTGACLWCSDELAALHRMTVERYLQERGTEAKLRGCIHPDDLDRYDRTTRCAMDQGVSYRVEYRFHTPSGEVRHVVESAECAMDPASGHCILVGCVIDITEQWRAEAALREANERLEQRVRERTAALEAALVRAEAAERVFSDAASALFEGLAIYDRDDRLLYHNPRYPELLDPSLAAEMRIGECWHDILDRALKRGPVYHADMGHDFAQRRRDWPSGPGRNVELRFADGRWIDVSESVLADGGYVVLLVDVTARKLAEAEARAMSERFVAAAESLVDGLVIFDAEDRIAFYNSRYPEHLAPSLRKALGLGKRFPDWIAQGLANGPIYHADMGEDFSRRRIAMRALPHSDHEHRLVDGRWVRIREARMPDGGRVLLTSDVTAIRAAERERRLLATVVEQAGDSVEIADPDYRLIYVNPAFTRLTGFAAGEALGRTPGSFLRSGRHDEAFFAGIDRVVRGGGVWTGRIVSRHKDGHSIEQDAVISPLFDELGRLAHFVAVKRDVTQQVRTAQALAESEARLAAFMRHAPVGMYVKDTSGRYLMANPEMGKVFGRPVEEVIGRDAADVFGAAEAAMIAGFDARILASGEPESTEEYLEGRDAYAWSLVFRFPIRDVAGAITQIGGFDVDITPQKRAQEALARNEALLRAIVQDQSEYIVRLDRHLRIDFVNVAFAKRRGLPAEALVGRDFTTMMRPVDRERFLRQIAGMSQDQPTADVEVTFELPDGTTGVELWTDRALFDEQGGITGYQSVGRDVSAERRAEAEVERQREVLRQGEKLTAMGSLLAGVAHELNNPLSIVIGQTELLHETAADSAVRARAEKIRGAAERCGRVVRTFLAMARKKGRDRKPVRLDVVARSVVELAAYGLRADGIAVTLDLDELPPVLAEEDQLDQVLANLVVNAQQALQAVDGERRLLVRGRTEGAWVRIEVVDNGQGVPAAIRGRIFDPFFTTKPVGMGTGLGLSICHGIVTSHGGTIEVGEAAGGGSAFTVRLPRSGAAREPEDVATVQDVSTQVATVLVVDDEPEIADLVAEVLRRSGHRVLIAGNGVEGLERLRAERIDLVLCDLRMPGLDGPRLKAAADAEQLAAPFLFMTGDTLSATAAMEGVASAGPLLEKPLQLDSLRRAVAAALTAS